MVLSADSVCLSRDHRDALHQASYTLLDQCLQDLIEVEARGDRVTDGFLYSCGYLPRAQAYRYGIRFLHGFARAIAIAGWKLDYLMALELTSVAEGLAAHAILREAELTLSDQGVVPDFEALWHALFAGTNILALFDPSRDGIDASATGRDLGRTSLTFDHWFTPFSGAISHVPLTMLVDHDVLLEEN